MNTPSPLPVAPRINRTGLAWREFNSLPATPPPVLDPPLANQPAGTAVNPLVANSPAHTKGRVLFVVAAAVAAGVVAGLFAFYPRSKTRGNATLPSTAITRTAAPTKPNEAAPTKTVVLPVVSPAMPADVPEPAKVPIKITTQPEEFRPPVEKHPYLDAKPKKTDGLSAQVGTKSHGPQLAAPSPRNDTKAEPKAAPAASPVEDFGMNLRRPTTSRPTRKIDETDPYAP